MLRKFVLHAALCLPVTLSTQALAESRGLSVELRTAPEATAPLAGRVTLYDNSYALVIGNDAYSEGWPSLSNAIADAREIAAGLSERGFEVTLVEDLDSIVLRETLREFFAIKGADPKARLLLWYAGHGHSIRGEGFLVPIDAPAPTEAEFKVRALHMRDFGGLMRLADSKHVLAIFDSCFSGTIFTTRAGAIPAAITRVTTRPTRQFMTSGDAEQQVSDDGTFRRLFLRALAGETTADSNGDGYLTGTELGLFLSDSMSEYTEDAQTPRYGKLRDPDYDRGDFVFALPGRIDGGLDDFDHAVALGEPVDVAEAMAEITLWTTVVNSGEPAVVQTYLDSYPTGRFARAAVARVEELNKQIAEREAAEAAARTAADAPAAQPADQQVAQAPAPTGEATSQPNAGDSDSASSEAASTFMPVSTDDPAEALELQGGFNLAQVSGSEDTSWLPIVTEGEGEFFQLTEQRDLPEGFFGTGGAAAELSADKATVRNVGPQGYRVPANAWRFSDPQGDSQYKVEKEWIHMRAPGNHNIWHCNRDMAPILSVPAPATDTWSAQVWVQLPARIGRSHVGLVAWNGIDEDGPTRALYVGPADTREVLVNGSYRSDCSASSGDIANRSDTSGRFRVEYAGGRGWLRLSRNGDTLSYYFKTPFMHNWHHLGTMQVEGKDDLTHVGLIAKTWGAEPVVASFADFRLIPGHSEPEIWTPSYLARLAQDGEARFAGQQFADFEWNDAAGDSIHEISDDRVHIKASGGRNMWNCNRETAPILSVDAPPLDRWTAEVDFELPARIGRSHVGLVAWNGEFEDAPVNALYFGPSDTSDLGVAGSNAIDCSSGAGDLRVQPGSSGPFSIKYDRSSGRLRIARDGDRISFFFKAHERRNWEHIGSTYASVRDDFSKIGLIAKTWGSEPVNVSFSNFRLIAGETEPDRWFPSYYALLRTGEPVTFTGTDYADFEWSDPDGNSVHEIRGNSVHLSTTGGHNGVWDCHRNTAPILSVAVPPRDAWVAQVHYRMGPRKHNTAAALALWNGAEQHPVRLLQFGPVNETGLVVSGSYADDCTAHAGEIAGQEGNSGRFQLDAGGDEGILQIVKFGWFYRFRYYDPETDGWVELGTVETTVKDNFNRIGLYASSWGGEPVESLIGNELSDFIGL